MTAGKKVRRLAAVDELRTYRGRRLDAGIGEFHQAIDLLLADTVPEKYWQKVLAERERRKAGA
jgi:hypothetical protein